MLITRTAVQGLITAVADNEDTGGSGWIGADGIIFVRAVVSAAVGN